MHSKQLHVAILLLLLLHIDLWGAELQARLLCHEVVVVAAASTVSEGLAGLRARVEVPAGDLSVAGTRMGLLRAGATSRVSNRGIHFIVLLVHITLTQSASSFINTEPKVTMFATYGLIAFFHRMIRSFRLHVLRPETTAHLAAFVVTLESVRTGNPAAYQRLPASAAW